MSYDARRWISDMQACLNNLPAHPWEIEQLRAPDSARVNPHGDKRGSRPVCYSSDPRCWDFIAAAPSDLTRTVAALRAVLDECDQLTTLGNDPAIDCAHLRSLIDAALGITS